MHNRFRTLVIVGVLAAVIAAVAAGGASARVLLSGAPVVSHVEQTTALPGYSDFPEVVRTMKDTFPTVTPKASVANSNDTGRTIGIGIGVGVAIAGVLTLFAVGLRRKRLTSAPA
jgi:hypothetical protein